MAAFPYRKSLHDSVTPGNVMHCAEPSPELVKNVSAEGGYSELWNMCSAVLVGGQCSAFTHPSAIWDPQFQGG